jgi:DNA-binding response OmpR family regulator
MQIVILVVEDEPPLRELLQAALEDEGYSLALAPSGKTALGMLDTDDDNYRAIITDVNLDQSGGPTGWDVARHARGLVPDVPIIYMTGAGAHEWGVFGVPNSVLIQKPFATGQITTALANLLNTGGPAPAAPV